MNIDIPDGFEFLDERTDLRSRDVICRLVWQWKSGQWASWVGPYYMLQPRLDGFEHMRRTGAIQSYSVDSVIAVWGTHEVTVDEHGVRSKGPHMRSNGIESWEEPPLFEFQP